MLVSFFVSLMLAVGSLLLYKDFSTSDSVYLLKYEARMLDVAACQVFNHVDIKCFHSLFIRSL